MTDMTTNPKHKNEAGQPSKNGGHFAAATHAEAPEGVLFLDRPIAIPSPELAALYTAQDAAVAHVDEFLTGGKSDLSRAQAETIVKLAEQFPGKAQVAVNDADDVWLMYNEPGDYDADNTVRVTLNEAGEVVSGGSGEDWEDNDWEDETYLRLLAAGFGEAEAV